MYGSVLESRAFRLRFFAVLIADSTFPFALLLPGLLVLCSKSHSLANLANSDEVNWLWAIFRTDQVVRATIPCKMVFEFQDYGC